LCASAQALPQHQLRHRSRWIHTQGPCVLQRQGEQIEWYRVVVCYLPQHQLCHRSQRVHTQGPSVLQRQGRLVGAGDGIGPRSRGASK
ncbi:unnamed protein product, partial [Closterium sp. NIES-53]